MPKLPDGHRIMEARLAAIAQRAQEANARLEDGLAALRRLVEIAKGNTGQPRRVADFLLAWWNPAACGTFALTDLWAVDADIVDDMVSVFQLVADQQEYPTAWGLGPDFEEIVAKWRPELSQES